MTTFGPDYVRAIAPYQGGKPISEVAREFGLDEAGIVKLASNENPLGLPASSKAAMQRVFDELARYPDSNGFDLKGAISKKFDVPTDWITLGNGSNDILELAARSLVTAGQSVVYAEYSFAVYPLATQAVGARHIVVPAKNYGHDLDAMRAALVAETDSYSPADFQKMLRAYPGIRVLEMPDCPGTVDDFANLRLGRMIRAQGIATHVPTHGSVRMYCGLAGSRSILRRRALISTRRCSG